jgi:hypothetical protein
MMRRTISAVVTTAVLTCGLFAASASAQSVPGLPSLPTAPSTPTVPGADSVVTTGCTGGLVSVNLGGTTVCAAPSVTSPAGTQSCTSGGIAINVAGQGTLCLAPGQNLGTVPGSGGTACPASLVAVTLPGVGGVACVVPTTIQLPVNGACADGLVPVTVVGASLGCVVANLIGTSGANGSNGSSGGGGAGASGTGADGTNGTNGTNANRTGAAGSSTSGVGRRVYTPTLTLSKKLRGSSAGTIRSSTKRVVITVIGRRHGRVVRFTKQASLRLTANTTAARPYSAKVKITVKTKGRISIRITSRGGAQVKTGVFKRTVRGH